MLPTRERIADLQARFDVSNGRIVSDRDQEYKNLNWYIRKGAVNLNEPGEWFCYGDVGGNDIIRLQKLLGDEEVIIMGWKDMGQNVFHDDFFGDGGGIHLVFNKDGIIYDRRRDGRIKHN